MCLVSFAKLSKLGASNRLWCYFSCTTTWNSYFIASRDTFMGFSCSFPVMQVPPLAGVSPHAGSGQGDAHRCMGYRVLRARIIGKPFRCIQSSVECTEHNGTKKLNLTGKFVTGRWDYWHKSRNVTMICTTTMFEASLNKVQPHCLTCF